MTVLEHHTCLNQNKFHLLILTFYTAKIDAVHLLEQLSLQLKLVDQVRIVTNLVSMSHVSLRHAYLL